MQQPQTSEGVDNRVLSADGHIDAHWLPGDIFAHEAPASLRDRLPRLLDTPQGKTWHLNGKPTYRPLGTVNASGKNYDRMNAANFFTDAAAGKIRPTDPDLRLGDQDRDGVAGEVMYGILGIDRQLQADPEALEFAYGTSRHWVADFCKRDPNRLVALVPLTGNPEHAVREVYDAATLGIRGVELKPRIAQKPFWHEVWEPLWNAIDDTELVVNFHSDISLIQPRGSDEDRAAHATLVSALVGSIGKMANAEFLGTLIYSGVLERHPKMRLVMGETDLGWIPHYLDRMDYMVTEREYGTGLPMLPSDYWRRQCKATFQNERLGVEMIKHLGIENVMWGNDYPHPDGTWPASHRVFDEILFDLTDAERHRILYANCAELYGFN